MKQFNLNDYVYIKLNDKGRDIYYHQYDNINRFYGKIMIKPKMPKEENGYCKLQAWEMMKIFGQHLGMGTDVPFETTVYFDDKDIKNKEEKNV